jgi:hypothetical protein
MPGRNFALYFHCMIFRKRQNSIDVSLGVLTGLQAMWFE